MAELMTRQKAFYDLNLPWGATDRQIITAFHQLAKKHHPDRDGGDTATFQRISRAYEFLEPVQSAAEKKDEFNVDEANKRMKEQIARQWKEGEESESVDSRKNRRLSRVIVEEFADELDHQSRFDDAGSSFTRTYAAQREASESKEIPDGRAETLEGLRSQACQFNSDDDDESGDDYEDDADSLGNKPLPNQAAAPTNTAYLLVDSDDDYASGGDYEGDDYEGDAASLDDNPLLQRAAVPNRNTSGNRGADSGRRRLVQQKPGWNPPCNLDD